MKISCQISNYTIYQLTGIRTEYTGRPDDITEYYVAFDGVHFPIEAKTMDEMKVLIMDRIFMEKILR